MNLALRAEATRRTLAAFSGVAFDWRHASCAHLLHAHLTNMGHSPPDMPPMGTKKAAREALKAMGARSLIDLPRMLGLPPIAGAAMLVGDVAILPGEGGRTDGIRGAVVICAGAKFMGWHEAGAGLQLIDAVMPHIKAAFRA